MRVFQRTAVQRRRGFLASFVLSAVGLCTVGAVAYACTIGSGETTNVSPNTGTAGTSLAVTTYTSGSGLASGTYFFRYAPPSGGECHHATAIGAGVSPVSGHIGSSSSPLSRTIPNLGGSSGQIGKACWATGTHVTAKIAADANIFLN